MRWLILLLLTGCASQPNHKSAHTASLCLSYLFPVSEQWHKGVIEELTAREMTHDMCIDLLKSVSETTGYSGSVRTYCVADPKRLNDRFSDSSFCLEDFQYRRLLESLEKFESSP